MMKMVAIIATKFLHCMSSKNLVSFLKSKLQLKIINKPEEATTSHGTVLDAVFARFLDDKQCKNFVAYYSYHKQIVTFIGLNNDTNNVHTQNSNVHIQEL